MTTHSNILQLDYEPSRHQQHLNYLLSEVEWLSVPGGPGGVRDGGDVGPVSPRDVGESQPAVRGSAQSGGQAGRHGGAPHTGELQTGNTRRGSSY